MGFTDLLNDLFDLADFHGAPFGIHKLLDIGLFGKSVLFEIVYEVRTESFGVIAVKHHVICVNCELGYPHPFALGKGFLLVA